MSDGTVATVGFDDPRDRAGMTGPAGMPGARGLAGGTAAWGLDRALVCGVLPAALLAAIVAVPAALWARLPARVADHWTLAGTANGTAPRLVSFALLGLIAVLAPRLSVSAWSRRGSGRRGLGTRPTRGPPARRRRRRRGLGSRDRAVPDGDQRRVGGPGGRGQPRRRRLAVGFRQCGQPGRDCRRAGSAAFAGYVLRRYGGFGGPDDGAPRSSLGLRAGERAVGPGGRAPAGRRAGALLVAAGAVAGTGHAVAAPSPLLAGRRAHARVHLGAGHGGRARGHGWLRAARAAADADPAAQDRVGRGGRADGVQLRLPGQPAGARRRGGRLAARARAAADAPRREDVPGHRRRRGDRGGAAQRPDRRGTERRPPARYSGIANATGNGHGARGASGP